MVLLRLYETDCWKEVGQVAKELVSGLHGREREYGLARSFPLPVGQPKEQQGTRRSTTVADPFQEVDYTTYAQ